MGLGTTTTTTSPLPAAPAALPDASDLAVLQARRSALRMLAAKRGLQSTFLQPSQVAPGAMSTLLGSGTGK